MARNRAYVDGKKSVPCVDCGGNFPPYVMEFDHKRDKSRNVSIMAGQGWSLSSIDEELSKCDVVCANCHKVRTYLRRSADRPTLS